MWEPAVVTSLACHSVGYTLPPPLGHRSATPVGSADVS